LTPNSESNWCAALRLNTIALSIKASLMLKTKQSVFKVNITMTHQFSQRSSTLKANPEIVSQPQSMTQKARRKKQDAKSKTQNANKKCGLCWDTDHKVIEMIWCSGAAVHANRFPNRFLAFNLHANEILALISMQRP